MDHSVIIRNTLFINAGAGSGKTYRLTHDLADFLTGCNANKHNEQNIKIDPQEVIVTTFSRAAAAEIKDRARQVLLDQGRTVDATQLETSSIGTIHSVAQRFINKYWYLIGACPNQEVLSDEDKTIYRNQSLAAFFDNGKYADQKAAVNAFFAAFKPKEVVDKISNPCPEFWARDVEQVVQKVSYYKISDLTKSRKESLAEADKLFGSVLDEKSLAILKNCINAVFDIAAAWLSDYENYKRRMGVIDYDDMEKGFYRLLTDEVCKDAIAQELRSNYKLVLVDEFQDCNPMQLQIFGKISEIISGNSGLPYSSIWVGDPNQAIYGFRGSDTDLINRVKSQFKVQYPEKSAEGLSKDSLATSYRSRECLVKYANRLFCTVGADGNPFFDEFTELDADRKSDSLSAPVMQWNFQKNSTGKNCSLVSFARQIKELVEERKLQIQPKGEAEPRDIRYGDIAILAFQNLKVDEIAAVLRREGVPAAAPESKILDRAEVRFVLAMLNLRHTVYEGEGDNKRRSRKVRPHEFATLLRLWQDKSTEEVLSERAENIANNKDDWNEDYAALKPIFVALDDCKDLPLDEKISALILELDIYDKVKKWGDADVRRQNLNTLQNMASQFVARCARMGLNPTEKEFDKYLNTVEIKSEVDRSSDSVTVTTYHKSKGLEWPMVILCSLDRDIFSDFHEREFYGVHELQCGEGDNIINDYYIHYVPKMPFPSTENPLPDKATFETTAICQKAKQRLIGEQKRLFYVGLTRARDYVVYFCTPTITKVNVNGDVRWNMDFKCLDSIGLKEGDLQSKVDIFPPLIPAEPTEPKAPSSKNPRPATIEKYKQGCKVYQEKLAEYNAAVAAEKAIEEDRKNPKPYSLHDVDALSANDAEVKYRHPSIDSEKDSAPEGRDFVLTLLSGNNGSIVVPRDAEGNDVLKYRHATFGTCVHNIYAAYPWRIENPSADELKAYAATANTIVHNYHLENVFVEGGVDMLVSNIHNLFLWLKQTYGQPVDVFQEYPFSFPYGEGGAQIMSGEMDLVYCTEKTDVIIDFKTHIVEDLSALKRKDDDSCVADFVSSQYVTQLAIYRDIWQKAHPAKEVKTYLYYNMLGGIVEL